MEWFSIGDRNPFGETISTKIKNLSSELKFSAMPKVLEYMILAKKNLGTVTLGHCTTSYYSHYPLFGVKYFTGVGVRTKS